MSSGDPVRPVCLLTGASGLLGQAFIRRARDRYSFAAVYHDSMPALASQETTFLDPLDPTADVAENDDPVFAVQADLRTQPGCEWAVQAALDRFGCIDLVVHAAVHSVWGRVLESDAVLDSAAEQFAVNVLAALHIASYVGRWDWSQHTAQDNRAANRNLVLMSSTAGVRLYPGSGHVVYGTTKAAVNHLTCELADEFADIGVRVTALAPDSFPEPVPLDTVVESAIALAACDVTGKVLVVDADGSRWLSPVQYKRTSSPRPELVHTATHP